MMTPIDLLKISFLLAPFLVTCSMEAQDSSNQPSFDVVSIRPSKVDRDQPIYVTSSGGPGTKFPTRFTGENISLRYLFDVAFGLGRGQLNAPSWTSSEMFNIGATVPEGTTKEQFRLMLQHTLQERFQLKFHWETKQAPIYELSISAGSPKFQQSRAKPIEDDDDGVPSQLPTKLEVDPEGYPIVSAGRSGMTGSNGRARLRSVNEPMEFLVRRLENQVQAPIHDATGLSGKYDFVLSWSTERMSTAQTGGAEEPTLLVALRSQLGLRLEKKVGSVNVLVIDHLDRTPTPN